MKKSLILVVVAAVALSACSKNEIIPEIEENAPAISFGTYGPRSITKANAANYVSGTELIDGAQFAVWGWFTDNGDSFDGTNGTKFFGNTTPWYKVTYNGGGVGTDGSANTYDDGPRYWPTGDAPKYLHFYAYYPSNAGTITPPAGLGAFDFTAEATAAAQVDFMVADVVKDQVYGATNATSGELRKGTVNLNFKHQLTRVQVKFKTTSTVANDNKTQIVVTSAAFGNINNTGKLTSSYNGTTFDTEWSNVSGTAAYTIAVPTGKLTATAANSGNVANDIFLLVPQTMTGPARDANKVVTDDTGAQFIDVEWTVTTDGVAITNTRRIYLDECVKSDDPQNANYTTQANIDWDKNNAVTYIITIAPNQILFTGAATAWDAPETYGYYNIN